MQGHYSIEGYGQKISTIGEMSKEQTLGVKSPFGKGNLSKLDSQNSQVS